MYQNEQGYLTKNRALYQFGTFRSERRCRRVFRECSRPSSTEFYEQGATTVCTKDQISILPREKQHHAKYILAPQGLHPSETLECGLTDSRNLEVVHHRSQPDPIPSESLGDIPPPAAVLDIRFYELLSLEYPYWWILPLCLSHVFVGTSISYYIIITTYM